jgi:chromosomal replication initiation ATPase DnaA
MNTSDQAKLLVEEVCKEYNITIQDLRKKKTGYPKKVVYRKDNYINIASIRQALSYFIFMHFPMRIVEIATICGYQDHSPMSAQRKTIENYIKVKYPYFYPYYEKLYNIAEKLNISTEYKRVILQYAPFMRHESNNEFAENIKYYENA